MKVLSIIGTRPQYIKSSVLNSILHKSDQIKNTIVNTGQHYSFNMSDVFFDEMSSVNPDYNLKIGGYSNNEMTAKMIIEIDKIILIEKPEYTIVYGDTNSTLAGAISAKKNNIKLIHIEAGLRSFDSNMQEEINRIITDRISDVLFCPTEISFKNLIEEGYLKFNSKIEVVGDVMLDVFKKYYPYRKCPDVKIEDDFIFATIHRAENTDNQESLSLLVSKLNKLSTTNKIIISVHPRLKLNLKKFNISFNSNILLIPPISYLEILYMLDKAKLLITDSGGLQKEAYFSKTPCITIRENTEWRELIEIKVNKLFDYKKECFNDLISSFKFDESNFNTELYGRGDASERIFKYLKKYCEKDN